MQKLYSEEYEKIILGCMLLDNSIIDDVYSRIKKDYFQFGKYATIFENIVELYNENNACDLYMLSQSIPQFAKDIADLTTDIPSAGNYEYYASKIKDLYLSRSFVSKTSDLVSRISDKNINEVLYEADDFVNACMNNVEKIEPATSKDMAISIIEDIQKTASRKGELEGFDTGYDALNEMDCMQRGNLVVIGARPSIGKSAFTDQLNVNLALNGVKTVTFSLEMTKKEIQRRRAGAYANVPISRIKKGLLSAAQGQRINQMCQKFFDTDMLLYDSASIGFDFNEIVSRIRVHAKQGYEVFFIDHLGLLEYGDNVALKEHEKISQMTKRFKKLAATLNITIVLVNQLTRDSEGKEPQLNSLRGSGSIEQDANVVMFLHRARQTSNELSIPTKLLIVKNRDGSCGEINFDFCPMTTFFRELDENGKPIFKQFEVVKHDDPEPKVEPKPEPTPAPAPKVEVKQEDLSFDDMEPNEELEIF